MAEPLSYAALNSALFDVYDAARTGAAPEAVLDRFGALAAAAGRAGEGRQGDLVDRYRQLLRLSLPPQPQTAAAAAAETRPVVLTTLNPFGRLDLQLRCFRRWQALGFEVFTCNHSRETEALVAAGLPPEAIVTLAEDETGAALHGKPVPKVQAVLRHAHGRFGRDLLLVNSDLYPAAETAAFLTGWRRAGTVLGLTRQEVLSIDHPVARLHQPYRGGIDAFWLPKDRLGLLIDTLAVFPVSDRMCFGIVGWDFFLGAVLLDRLGGTIADSHVLWHEMHRPTYDEIGEFAHYVPAMQALGIGPELEMSALGAAFAAQIDALCQSHGATGTDPALAAVPPAPTEGPVAAASAQLAAAVPQTVGVFGPDHIAAAAAALAAGEGVDLATLIARLPDPEVKRAFAHVLVLGCLALWLWPGAPAQIRDRYPPGNRHGDALRFALTATEGQPDLRRLEIAKLFVIDLAAYGIFNPRLYNVLALSAENAAERRLLTELRALARERSADAA